MKLKDKDNTAWQKYAAGAISIVCFLIIWQLVVSFTRVGLVMVGPIEVIKSFCSAFVSPIGRNTIQSHIVWSMTRVMIGFFMGSILGIVLGICMGWNKNVESFFRPLFELIRPIPPIAWIPLSIVWLGTGESSKYFIIFLGAFFPIVTSSIHGVSTVPKQLVESARVLGADEWFIFRKILLPAAGPTIVNGLRTGLGVAWTCLVSAEMLPGSLSGVGYMIMHAYEIARVDVVMAGMISIGVTGALLDYLFRIAERKKFSWKR